MDNWFLFTAGKTEICYVDFEQEMIGFETLGISEFLDDQDLRNEIWGVEFLFELCLDQW